MAKVIWLLLVVASLMGEDLFHKRCISCHQARNLDLKKIFFDYLLHYSSERRIKQAMKEQLLHPDPKRSLVDQKKLYKHTIDPNELEILLQIYWNRYKVIGKIR